MTGSLRLNCCEIWHSVVGQVVLYLSTGRTALDCGPEDEEL